MRLFIAINFNDETKSQLLDLRDELCSCAEDGNFSLPENLHLTLAFLGECDTKQEADAKAAMDAITIMPLKLVIDRIGRFRRDNGDIWWVGVQKSNSLLELQHKLTRELSDRGFVIEQRRYNPHITLGRKVSTHTEPWRINSFGETICKIELMKSERIHGKLTYTSIYQHSCLMQDSF